MIPKIIHYCWFGPAKPSALELRCMASWKKYCPDYDIKLWNEDNFDVNYCEFTKEAYRLGKYAFVSDVARLYALQHEGGVYLDTDMLLLKNINEFLHDSFFTGEYKKGALNAAIIGSISNFQLIENLLTYYQQITFDFQKPKTIPEVFDNYIKSNSDVKIYSKEYFYPLPFDKKDKDYRTFLSNNSYAVHLWNHSWKDEMSLLNDFRFISALKVYLKNSRRYHHEYKAANRHSLFFSKFRLKLKAYIHQMIFTNKKR